MHNPISLYIPLDDPSTIERLEEECHKKTLAGCRLCTFSVASAEQKPRALLTFALDPTQSSAEHPQLRDPLYTFLQLLLQGKDDDTRIKLRIGIMAQTNRKLHSLCTYTLKGRAYTVLCFKDQAPF